MYVLGVCSDRRRKRGRGVGRVSPPSPAAVPGHAARAAAAPAPRAAPPAAALPAGETAAGAGSALAHERPIRTAIALKRSRLVGTTKDGTATRLPIDYSLIWRLLKRYDVYTRWNFNAVVQFYIIFISCQSSETASTLLYLFRKHNLNLFRNTTYKLNDKTVILLICIN